MEAFTDKVELSFEHVGYIWLDYAACLGEIKFQKL